MQIKELAQRTGLPETTIRYYESIGVLPSPQRRANSYRDYDEEDVAIVRFVSAARCLNLSPSEIAELVSVREQYKIPSRATRALIAEQLEGVTQLCWLLQLSN